MIGNKLYKNIVIASALFASGVANAAVDDPFGLRVRWIIVAPDASSTTITNIGGNASVDTEITPEIDFSYFFTDNIAVELISAVTRHRAKAYGTSAGNVNLGEVNLLPPTLTLQWHFLPHCLLNPYIGAGINYTYFFGENPGALARYTDYTDSFGGVLQAGVNLNFKPKWHLNLDVKKVYIDTDATVQFNTPPVSTTNLEIDPWIIGVGIGYRF